MKFIKMPYTVLPNRPSYKESESCGMDELSDVLDKKRIKSTGCVRPSYFKSKPFTVLPDELLDFENIEYLTFERNKIKVLPDNIDRLINLKYFDLVGNPLERLPESFMGLKCLETLEVAGISKLDWNSTFDILAKLPKLKSLSIGCEARYCQIPFEKLGKLTNLENIEIFFDGAGAKRFFSIASKLKKLKKLKIYMEVDGMLPESIGDLKSLEVFYFVFCKPYCSFPQSFGRLKDLKVLILDNTENLQFPEEMKGLSSLEHLSLYECRLGTLPDWVEHMGSLKKLDVRGNKFKALPESLSYVQHVAI